MQQCQVRVFPQFFVPSFDSSEWCLKNGLHSGGLNPGPLGHESSALTTRPVFFNLGSAEPRGSAKIFLGSAKYVYISFFGYLWHALKKVPTLC